MIHSKKHYCCMFFPLKNFRLVINKLLSRYALNKFMRLCFNLFIIFFVCCFSLFAEENSHVYSIEEAKAHYTFQTFKHITWPDEVSIDTFTLGIIAKDKKLINTLIKIEDKTIRGKKITVEELDIPTIKKMNFSAIFIGEKKKALTPLIKQRFPKTLIITDGRIHKDNLMVALVLHNNDMKIELNREKFTSTRF